MLLLIAVERSNVTVGEFIRPIEVLAFVKCREVECLSYLSVYSFA
jgi:hypothetical protein